MGSRGRPLFDLNEPPAEDDEETDHVVCLQPHKALPSANPHTSDLFAASIGSQGIKNNNAFSHASAVSGFQPFVRPKVAHGPEVDQNPKLASPLKSSNGDDTKATPSLFSGSADVEAVEREEGEWSDAEGSAVAYTSSSMNERGKASQDQDTSELMESGASGSLAENISGSAKVTNNTRAEGSGHTLLGLDQGVNDQKSSSSRNSDGNANGDISMDGQEEAGLNPKQREVRGVEASHALKYANNLGKRKIDQHKEAMLGKKRNRQTVLLNLDEAKLAGSMKSSTPRRQPTITRTVKEVRSIHPPAERAGEKHIHPINKDQKQADLSCNEGGTSVESCQPKSECNGDINSGQLTKLRRLNGDTDFSAEVHSTTIPRQSSWKQPADLRQPKSFQFSNRKPALISQSSMDSKLGNKKHPPVKKPTAVNTSYQDTSVERLIREVTNEKFWHHPGIN